ncbi:hypothetical protein ABW19_dt0201199 [Dactylella cylindrospora]|nr:hypothetical protein ABW19_dt0201199 [Dactylella cylindrospora]
MSGPHYRDLLPAFSGKGDYKLELIEGLRFDKEFGPGRVYMRPVLVEIVWGRTERDMGSGNGIVGDFGDGVDRVGNPGRVRVWIERHPESSLSPSGSLCVLEVEAKGQCGGAVKIRL